jgi:hypothetical protein
MVKSDTDNAFSESEELLMVEELPWTRVHMLLRLVARVLAEQAS